MKEEKKTRRRTKFDFDLWDSNTDKESKKAMENSEWIKPETKKHNLVQTGRMEEKSAGRFSHQTF